MELSPSDRLKKARINLLTVEPFFGSLMMQLKPVEDPTVRTCCTDGDKLWYNPDYMAKQDDGQPSDGQGEGAGQGDGPASRGEFIAGAADEAEAQAQEAKWKVALKQAVMSSKSQGRLPGNMERMVTELLDPKASWREILRTLLTSIAKDDYTWTRPNPRYTGRGL